MNKKKTLPMPVKNADKLSKRGLHLSDTVMLLLTLLSLERKQSLSQIANQVLLDNLPAFTVKKNWLGSIGEFVNS